VATQTIHLKDDLLFQIKIKAEENERSISSEIAYRLKLSLQLEDKNIEQLVLSIQQQHIKNINQVSL
jgi:hypothetical protein